MKTTYLLGAALAAVSLVPIFESGLRFTNPAILVALILVVPLFDTGFVLVLRRLAGRQVDGRAAAGDRRDVRGERARQGAPALRRHPATSAPPEPIAERAVCGSHRRYDGKRPCEADTHGGTGGRSAQALGRRIGLVAARPRRRRNEAIRLRRTRRRLYRAGPDQYPVAMSRRRSSLGFLGIFGRSSDLRQLDAVGAGREHLAHERIEARRAVDVEGDRERSHVGGQGGVIMRTVVGRRFIGHSRRMAQELMDRPTGERRAAMSRH